MILKASPYVTAAGSSFMLDGQPYTVRGANCYYLAHCSATMRDCLLDAAVAQGWNTLRTWAFLDTGQRQGVWFQAWEGACPVIHEGDDGLGRLTGLVKAARQRRLRLILTLTNNWPDFGGMPQYRSWYGCPEADCFYTDPRLRTAYQRWVARLLQEYRDDPTVLAWELANEPRAEEAEHLLRWADEMSQFIREQGARQLVAVGDEGFFAHRMRRSPLYDGSHGVDCEALLRLPAIDFGTYHLYPESWQQDAEWGTQWIMEHRQVAAQQQKPMLLTEFGWRDQSTRSAVYAQWRAAAGEDGGLFWMAASQQHDGTPYPDYDGYTITFDAEQAT